MQHDPRFLKGIDEFNRGFFYEAHETLEQLWLEDHGPEREFYQGIIQVAAAYFKWEQEVPRGTIKLLRSGIRQARTLPACLSGRRRDGVSVGHRADLADVEAWCGGDGPVPELRIPRLSPEGRPAPDSRASRE